MSSSSTLRTIQCFYCVKKEVALKEFPSHLASHHKLARFGCGPCHSHISSPANGQHASDNRFDTMLELRIHLIASHKIKTEASQVSHYIADQLTILPDNKYLFSHRCAFCHLDFHGFKELAVQSHFNQCHDINVPKGIKISCRICGADKFDSEATVLSHINTLHPRHNYWLDIISEQEQKVDLDFKQINFDSDFGKKAKLKLQVKNESSLKEPEIIDLSSDEEAETIKEKSPELKKKHKSRKYRKKNRSSSNDDDESEDECKTKKSKKLESSKKSRSKIKKRKRDKESSSSASTSSSQSPQTPIIKQEKNRRDKSPNLFITIKQEQPDKSSRSTLLSRASIAVPIVKSEERKIKVKRERSASTESGEISSPTRVELAVNKREKLSKNSKEIKRESRKDEKSRNRRDTERTSDESSDGFDKDFCDICIIPIRKGEYKSHKKSSLHVKKSKNLSSKNIKKERNEDRTSESTSRRSPTRDSSVFSFHSIESRSKDSRTRRSRSRSRSHSRGRRSQSRTRRSRSRSRTQQSCSRNYRSRSRTRQRSRSRNRRSRSRTQQSCSPNYRSRSRTQQSCSPNYRSRSRTQQSRSRNYRSRSRTRQRSRSRIRRSRSRTFSSRSRIQRSRTPISMFRTSQSREWFRPMWRSRSRTPTRRICTPPRFVNPYDFHCQGCNFVCDTISDRILHTSSYHWDIKYSCRKCRKFSAFTEYIVELHLKRAHKLKENELQENVIPPKNPKEVNCLLCIEAEGDMTGIWMGRDPTDILVEMRGHLKDVHKSNQTISESFCLKCRNCDASFSYLQKSEWLEHVKSHSNHRPQTLRKCDYCPEDDEQGHILTHVDVAFRCKQCPTDSLENFFVNYNECCLHANRIHNATVENPTDFFVIPENLDTLKCKCCELLLYAQTIEDFKIHFKSSHSQIDNFSSHLEYLCRMCVKNFETLMELRTHQLQKHRNIISATAGTSEPANGATFETSANGATFETSTNGATFETSGESVKTFANGTTSETSTNGTTC